MIRSLTLALLVCVTLLSGRLSAQQATGATGALLVGESQAPAVQLCQLLFHAEIRKKLSIKDEQFQRLTDQLKRLEASCPTVQEFETMSFDDRFGIVDKMAGAAQKMDASIWSVLSELLSREEMRALMGAHVRVFGFASILNPRIAEELSITDGQRDAIAKAIEQHRGDKRSLLTDIAKGKKSFTAVDAKLTQDRLISVISLQLDESQRARLTALIDEGRSLGSDLARLNMGW